MKIFYVHQIRNSNSRCAGDSNLTILLLLSELQHAPSTPTVTQAFTIIIMTANTRLTRHNTLDGVKKHGISLV